MKKIFDSLFSTRAAGVYMLIFAAAIGIATFVENDFGTSSAQKIIFRAKWFELLLVLFCLTLINNIIKYRMIQQKKWAVFTFHSAIIIILIGAGITRYLGYEGLMHIREGSSSNQFMSSETFLKMDLEYNDNRYRIAEPVYFASLGNNYLKRSYRVEDKLFNIEVVDFIPNPEKNLEDSPEGLPTIKLVVAGGRGREEYFIRQGDVLNLNGTTFNFGNPERADAVNMYFRNDSLVFNSPFALTQMQMATQRRDSISPGVNHLLMPRSLYSNERINFVMADFRPGANVVMTSGGPKMRNESIAALQVKVTSEDGEQWAYVSGNKGSLGVPVTLSMGDMEMKMSYGAKMIELPFSIYLHDFIMERYPGTNSASSYASEVTLTDTRENLEMDYRIYMNHILNYGGYRFFQSSFDQDELGTVLSVNHDFWGTLVSYIGYFLLTLGMILTLFSKKSRFSGLARKLKDMRKGRAIPQTAVTVAVVLCTALSAHANGGIPNPAPGHQISAEHASRFGRVVVQDHKGRMKPINTMTSEVLRKIARKESMHGLSSDQIFLAMTVYPNEWTEVPLIRLGRHEEIKRILGTDADHVSFAQFFSDEGEYILKEDVNRAYSLEPIDRGKFEKEVMKLDERVNIVNMILARRLMKIYPVPEDENNLWIAPGDVSHQRRRSDASNEFIEKFYPAYVLTIQDAVETGDWSLPGDLLDELHNYQVRYGSGVMLPDSKVKLEIWLNKANVFGRLDMIYGLLGFLFLVAFFATIINHKLDYQWIPKVAFALLGIAFVAHTAGLGVRWYVSGHAPWSNGYESMIYIAWTTILAGLIFARKSLGGLAATSILSAIILMVAGLSWMDPEITPLVPVLKSYWLTIHVSLEAGSYGFLMLGAIIGALNLLAMIFLNADNKQRIMNTVRELSFVSEMTLTGGLIMISVGTYLGGIWANESWGRYWGWDAKETWALVTILVYAFILHMRLIPGLRGFYAFNVASLFGFFSVMMTYFGVNYYLSGLHSYATGDPAPIPTFVYYTVGSLLVISLLALWKHRKFAVK